MTALGQGRFLFDTNAALYFMGNELADVLPIGSYHISVISEIELLSYPNLSTKEEGAIRDFLSKIETIGLRSDVTETAIAFRRQHRMKLPDAIIAASASVLDAVLLTNDSALLKLPGIRAMALKLR
ncbi:MAG: type II toxin-antitoxin system VapC family toxin [Nitrospirales bacterium]